MSDVVSLRLEMPAELRLRAKKIGKRLRISAAQLIRDALTEKIEFLEAKFRAEEEAKRAERDRKPERGLRSLEDRRTPVLTGTTTTLTAPKAPLTVTTRVVPPPLASAFASLPPIYEREAKKIFDVLDNPPEKRLRTVEAIAAIKREHPLSYPADTEILLNLERCVVELRAKAPPKRMLSLDENQTPRDSSFESRFAERLAERVADNLTGRTIDVSKIESHGDVDDDVDDPQPE